MGVLGIDDEAFWEDPFVARELVLERLEEEDTTGILLDAPARVYTRLRDDVPLAGALRYPGDRARGLRFHERAVVVVVRAASNEVFAARVFPWKEPAFFPRPPELPPDDPDDGPITLPIITEFFWFFLRERLSPLPWRACPLHAVILCGDQRSNLVTVSLEDPPESNPRVQAFVETHRSPGYPRAVFPPQIPGVPWPLYTKTPESPELPALGIALSLPPEVHPSSVCIVRASFALPLLERERVRPFDPHVDRFARITGASWVDVGDPDALAVAAISLVLCADEGHEPVVLRLDVPVYTEREGLGYGYFAVDLFAWKEVHRMPGRYTLWAFSGDVVAGPNPLVLHEGV